MEKRMIKASLTGPELQDEWSDADPSIRLRSTFPLHRGTGAENSTVVYFELEPGKQIGTHTDSVEEVVLLLEGTVGVTVDGEEGKLSAGELALVPAMAPHTVRNIGSGPARGVGFFAAARVVSTFEHELSPSGLRVFDTAEL
jgi:quercetin dioxygenase-like cupin family protein